MSFLRFMALVLVLGLLVGCSGQPGSISVTPPPQQAPADAAKAALKDMADSGQVGSGIMAVRENLEKLKSTDAAKGEALLKELDELSKLNQPDAVKAKAKAMMEKL